MLLAVNDLGMFLSGEGVREGKDTDKKSIKSLGDYLRI
jgi:hypothetical protein